ncbi:MAG TPA: M1 family aminopeptidase [Acidobacteriaceae bacterium]|nr:M1 family aminopeptidase [Acidobacteriaceae bacterium]
MQNRTAGVCFLCAVWAVSALAQQPVPASSTTPQQLADLVLQRFASGSAAEFEAVDPDPLSRAVVEAAIQRKATREGNLGRVVWSSPDRAILLLTGTVENPDSAVETIRSRHFSGFYEAVEKDGAWTLTRQLPFDDGNTIHAQTIVATISPGVKIEVEDTLDIESSNPAGFAVRLNDSAQLKQILLNGHAVKDEFGGGVLWLSAPIRAHSRLTIEYSLAEVRQDPDEKPQPGPPRYGSFVNETVWTPVFDFDSANDYGSIDITLRLPATYYATTSVPQTEQVKSGVRIVHGHTSEPEFILSLIYDEDWKPTEQLIGNLHFATFLTPEFRWTPETLGQQVRTVDDWLSRRFGPPQSDYLAVAEERDLGHHGFAYRTNDLVVSGGGGSPVLVTPEAEAASNPNAPLAHEASHGWTMQATGPGANFLREGWATYCEWNFVGLQYGPAVEAGIWQTAYNYYLLGGHDGVRSILGNPDNGSIHYVKGAWILHMLEEILGQATFDAGMRNYIRIPRDQKAGYEEFIAAMSKAAGRDMGPFILPWLTGKYIPNLQAQIEGSQIIVTQTQSETLFALPLELALTTGSGSTVERTVEISGKTTTVDAADLGAIERVRIDPGNRLLLRRNFGETVSFTLRDAQAKTVALSGNFTLKPVAAVRSSDTWSVQIRMTQGRYSWTWVVDGKPLSADLEGQAATGVRIVEALQPATDAYPKQ